MKINLVLKQSESQRKRKSDQRMIFVNYAYKSQNTTFFTKKNIPIKMWDKKNQCVKRAYAGHSALNAYLQKCVGDIRNIVNMAMLDDIDPTVTYVKDIHKGRVEAKKKQRKLSFWDFTETYMENAKIRLSANTLRSYKTILKNIKGYERYARIKLDWHNIDMDFYYSYMDYYLSYKALKTNGFGKVIKLLKSILNSATDQGYNTNMIYKSKAFKVISEDTDNIYLNEEELSKIIGLDLSDNKKLERVRDLFYIGCYTGLRFSDYNQITSENIKGGNLHVKTKKTGTLVVIPLLEETKSIIAKYNGNLPKAYTNQVTNRYLKQIGQLAGLTSDFNTYHTSGKGRIKQTFKKYEMISTHTARRSFATNMYKRGLDTIMIMGITGHSSEKVFMDYIKISKEENAKLFLAGIKKRKNAA
ncbi:tyrosine-type recombinase/integrase [Winogradskyella sp. 4-2091]|uniref:site-specific integrase n=1 Tax=Winogradskyella sp. 4-2091 TaxID=3381659 RepID=UPI00389222D2